LQDRFGRTAINVASIGGDFRDDTFFTIAEHLAQSNNYSQALLICRQDFGKEYLYQFRILSTIVENLINDKQYTQILSTLESTKEKLEIIMNYKYKNYFYFDSLHEETSIMLYSIINFLTDLTLWGRDDKIKELIINDWIEEYYNLVFGKIL
jgi:hypothetical protein